MREFQILLIINLIQEAGKKILTGCDQTMRESTQTRKKLSTGKDNGNVKLRSLKVELSPIV
jgi:hypothetical protein